MYIKPTEKDAKHTNVENNNKCALIKMLTYK